MKRMIGAACLAASLAALTACDSGAKATAAADAPATAPAPAAQEARPQRWAESRSRTAAEAAQAQFERNGAAFGAANVDDYVAKAHAFIAHPPKGAETLTRRNGDRLIYDPKANVFAVATAEGAPRTLFKPRDGAAYWAEQKTRATQQAARNASDADG